MTLGERIFGLSFAVIPLAQMRMHDVGDWLVSPSGTISVIVADTGSRRYNFLIGLHEAIEAKLCVRHGITQQEVDDWDTKFPMLGGDSVLAPYHREHVWATRVERIVAILLGVRWQAYDKCISTVLHA